MVSPIKDKLETLEQLIGHVGDANGIVFCNFKDTIRYVSDFLTAKKIKHACFYGGMEQIDRERSLVKFRNGSHRILLATDLAARGIDVPELDYIVHYQIPSKEPEFTHRNGRTARMHNNGTAYIMRWAEEELPEFIVGAEIEELSELKPPPIINWQTLFISGGRKDKISKGDIAGLFMKQGQLRPDQIGVIEIKQDCSFVAVKKNKVDKLIKTINNSRLKKKKVRISILH